MSSLLNKARLVRAYLTGKPVWCTWQVTYACNFRCSFCDYWKEDVNYSPEARKREATLDDVRHAAEILAELGSLIISLGGGEPLLRSDLVEIVAVLAPRHFPLITTNGSLITMQRARELWDSGMCGISVSLDYDKATTDANGRELHDVRRGIAGAGERARRAIHILSRTRTRPDQRVNLLCVLHRDNLDDVEELIRFAADNGATFSIQPYCGFKSDKHQYAPDPDVSARLLSLKRRYPEFRSTAGFLTQFDSFLSGCARPCLAGRAFFNIDNFLNVQKCVEFREETLGNLRDISPQQMLARLRAEHHRNACTACWYGCRGEVEQFYSVRGLLSLAGL